MRSKTRVVKYYRRPAEVHCIADTRPHAAAAAGAARTLEPQQTAATANTNAYVVNLQAALRHKGYYHRRLDGKGGPQTQRAIAHFQHNLHVPPRPPVATWTRKHGLRSG